MLHTCALECDSQHRETDKQGAEEIEHIVGPTIDGFWLTNLEQDQLPGTDGAMGSGAVGSSRLIWLEMVAWVKDLEEMG